MSRLVVKTQRLNRAQQSNAMRRARGLSGLSEVRRVSFLGDVNAPYPDGVDAYTAAADSSSWNWDNFFTNASRGVNVLTTAASALLNRTAQGAPAAATPPPSNPLPAAAADSQWIKGVPNGLVIAGGGIAALVVLGMVFKKK